MGGTFLLSTIKEIHYRPSIAKKATQMGANRSNERDAVPTYMQKEWAHREEKVMIVLFVLYRVTTYRESVRNRRARMTDERLTKRGESRVDEPKMGRKEKRRSRRIRSGNAQ